MSDLRKTIDRPQTLTIAVIGDVHDLWDDADAIALDRLGVDLALFVGDFGNESIPVVRQIAQLDRPKAAILGNHDAWYTATDWGRKKCPYDRQQENRVQQQLDLLGNAHVGYGALDFPQFELAVVGGRPFSWGGPKWHNAQFYRQWYDVGNFEESVDRIVSTATATDHNTLILLGHTGPTGLGALAEDPCGKDWEPRGGDYGDPDLEAAIDRIRQSGKSVPLVAFGHMHHQLRHTKTQLRRCIHISPDGETVYLNAARTPRIVSTPTGTHRNFSLVSLQGDTVTRIALVWVDENERIVEKTTLYRR